MRHCYYGLGDGEAWAVMSHDVEGEPPILLFASVEVAESYRRDIAGDEWEVMEIDNDEISVHAQTSGGHVMLCTSVLNGRIQKLLATLDELDRRESEMN